MQGHRPFFELALQRVPAAAIFSCQARTFTSFGGFPHRGHVRCPLGNMKHHEHYTELEQDQLDWISRFADRLRQVQPQFAEERASGQASEIAAMAWERPDWRGLSPEGAADRWLREQPVP